MVIFYIEADNAGIVCVSGIKPELAYGLTGRYGTYAEYKKVLEKKQKIQNRDSLRVDVHLGSKLFKFRGKIVKISYDIPPNPIIRRMI